jgi:hypothetical protein
MEPEEFQHVLDDRGRKIYSALQEGRFAASMAVDLACFLADWGRMTPAIRQLLEIRLADLSEPQAETLAKELLQDIQFDPGFTLAPHRIDNLRLALHSVQADFSPVRIVDDMHLRVDEEEYGERARITLHDQSLLSTGNGIPASAGDDPTDSLVAIAEEVQDEVADRFRLVWPVCPEHRLGTHPVKAESAAWWRCGASGGHVVARIGSLRPADT